MTPVPFVPLAWGGSAAQSGEGIWAVIGILGPAAFAAFVLFLVVRAVLRQGRYRVVRVFGEDDRRAVREAVGEAERKTVGEILPVVVERSDPHPGADWLTALLFALLGSSLLIVWLPWDHPTWLLLVQLVLGAIGFALARALPDLKRSFVFEDRATAVAEEQAFQEFYANGLHRTKDATGVLLFVSLFERRVVVLADEGIDSEVEQGFWHGIDVAVLDEVRAGSLRDGLVEAVRRVGDLLSEKFPWVEGDRNEIPDRVIVRRE
jgi:putative membrane protein